ncbi:MAG: flagellar type III secretion system pore protein FliP [Gammaproteobacteria bacterium]|nr:flagellar type III secretion system pore protein FliP [Gammaproteobacteria bacterium]
MNAPSRWRARAIFYSMLCSAGVLLLWHSVADAASVNLPGVAVTFNDANGSRQEVSSALQIMVMLTVLSLAPAILVVMTGFTRIIIVLSMLRHAFGMQETPPNTVLVSLALFLTLFTMLPTISQVNEQAYEPYMTGKLSMEKAVDRGMKPMREFMIRQTREQDLQLMLEVAKAEPPETIDDVKTLHLIPAFMLSELKTAFQIGFVIFLPFLLIDIVVSSVLMSMGMMMVPPMMISMPLKILMFVLIDGWNLVTRSLLYSFQ